MTSAADRGAEIRIALPRDFSAASLPPPDLAQAPQLSIETWQSATDTHGDVVLAWGCIAGETREWSRDATDLAQGKLVEIASGTAARMRGRASPMHVTSETNAGLDRALALDDGAGYAHTMLRFTRDRAHGCFAVCTSASCESTARDAEPAGTFVDAPAPGIALRSLALVVHHPHGALAALGAVLVSCAMLAVLTRPGRRRH